MTAAFPARIETARLVLRPLDEDDAEAMLDAVGSSRAELERWIHWPTRMHTIDEARRAIAGAREAAAAGVSRELGIIARGDGGLLGGINLRVLNGAVPSFALAYWLRTPAAGHGYAREAVRALTGPVFDRLGARRVVIACDPENRRSARVAETCGFALEARLRNEIVSPVGEVRDLLVYAMIDTDDAARALVSGGRNAVDSDNPVVE